MVEPPTPSDARDPDPPGSDAALRSVAGLPRLAMSAVPRPRLFAELSRSTGFPLTILRGPGGSGKTTLLLDWIRQPGGDPRLSVRWLDGTGLNTERGRERDGFWGAVLAVLTESTGAETPAAAPVPSSARLADAIRVALDGQPVLLVVDGWDGAALPGPADEVIDIATAVSRLSWIVTTQFTGHLERRGTLEGLDMAVIGPAALRFTVDETEELLHGSPLAGQARPVRTLCGGSPRFTRALVLRSADPTAAPRGTLDEAAGAVVDDLRAVLRSGELSGEHLDFMVRTSVPEDLDLGLAQILSDAADADVVARLDAAARHGYGDWAGRGAFAYVPLVRSALLAELGLSRPGEVSKLNRACARHLTRQGNPRAALGHALAAGDLDAATAVLRHWALEMTDEPERESTIDALRSLGTAKLARYPIVAMVLALAYLTSNDHRANGLELLSAAKAGVRNLGRGMPPADRMLLSTLEVIALRVSGHVQAAGAATLRALERHAALSDDEREEIGHYEHTMLAQFALTLLVAGHTEPASSLASRAVTAAAHAGRTKNEGHALGVAAWVQAVEGDVRHAAALVRRARGTGWVESGPSPYSTTPLRLARSVVDFERLDVSAGRATLAPILPEVETSEFWPQIVAMSTMFDLLAGDAALSLGKLRAIVSRQRGLPPTSPAGEWALDASTAWLHLALGDGASALRALSRYREKGAAQSLLRARVHLARGQSEDVLQLTARITDGDTPSQRFDAAVLALAVRLRVGDTADIDRGLRETAGMSSVFGLVSPVALLPAPDLGRIRSVAESRGVEWGLPLGFGAVIPGDLVSVELTPRETAVLRELAATGNAAAIADSLFVSVNTVKSQLRSLYRKLGASRREEALAAARRYGLFRD